VFRYIVIIALLVVGFRFGYNYLGSEDFQRYGDEHNAQWTCRVNNLMGDLCMTMSRYGEALRWFEPVLKRCPKTSIAEEALFRKGTALEAMGRRVEAAEIYRKYAETYKGTKRAVICTKAADMLTGP
jgi:TolA-binding protein